MGTTIRAGKGQTVVAGSATGSDSKDGTSVGAVASDGGTVTIAGSAVGRQTTRR